MLGKPPINQLLATGGVLFFLQSIATLFFGVEFLSLGVSLGSFELTPDIYISKSQFVAFIVAGAAVAAMYVFLSRSYMGVAIRAISRTTPGSRRGATSSRIRVTCMPVTLAVRSSPAVPTRRAVCGSQCSG